MCSADLPNCMRLPPKYILELFICKSNKEIEIKCQTTTTTKEKLPYKSIKKEDGAPDDSRCPRFFMLRSR